MFVPTSIGRLNALFSNDSAMKYRGFEAAPRFVGFCQVTVIVPTASPPRATTPNGADGTVAAYAGSTIVLMNPVRSATRATITVPRRATAMRSALVPRDPVVR